ncbi:Maf family nucleotide pyrophosphatase [Luteimonas sp. RD2P54]|uniref:7-methyl-GTP pyrophosphatase n=1 Tax=Luteimonas endophytica TaxID=3042023 RepID=A0ABT6J3J6_9GAMM|nr:Maf family nucleotide pyrophosphatase [Luteimonas endophytica]MDH5821400.1 Maf family nucleotide pyrophosphatase [Luteimonas endophytica]
MRLLLASTSRYRRSLLQRLGLAFDVVRPEVDESPCPGETPDALVRRLARAKAAAAAAPGTWSIGSDQLAELGGRPIGKPGSREAACGQLALMSAARVRFLTAVALRHGDGRCLEALDVTEVRFRALTGAEIERYVDTERPFDCAGSFKAEGLGIALFEAIRSEDPTALVGLPLIATARLLREAGFAVP